MGIDNENKQPAPEPNREKGDEILKRMLNTPPDPKGKGKKEDDENSRESDSY